MDGIAIFQLFMILCLIGLLLLDYLNDGTPNTGWGVVMGIALTLNSVALLGRVIDQYEPNYRRIAEKQIESCEANLPRNITCEAVITAKPKESK